MGVPELRRRAESLLRFMVRKMALPNSALATDQVVRGYSLNGEAFIIRRDPDVY